MSIRVSNVRLSVDEPEAALAGRLARLLDVPADELSRWRLLRNSLDARNKSALGFVYTAEVQLPDEQQRIGEWAKRGRRQNATVELREEPPFTMPAHGERRLEHRPVVVGS